MEDSKHAEAHAMAAIDFMMLVGRVVVGENFVECRAQNKTNAILQAPKSSLQTGMWNVCTKPNLLMKLLGGNTSRHQLDLQTGFVTNKSRRKERKKVCNSNPTLVVANGPFRRLSESYPQLLCFDSSKN